MNMLGMSMPGMKKRVLIRCTGTSARSQMAEGLLRAIAGERVEVFSAGSKPSVVNPYAIRAVQKRGIDIFGQRPKHLSEYLAQPFDYAITVCDPAAETCPIFPDPAAVHGSDDEVLVAFEHVRDSLEAKLKAWAAGLQRQLIPLPSADDIKRQLYPSVKSLTALVPRCP